MLFDPNFDPSKLDPKLIAELTDLMKQLPPDKIMRMQSLMHNSMAGFNVQKEMMEFENSLPAEFRAKLFRIVSAGMMSNPDAAQAYAQSSMTPQMTAPEISAENMDIKGARMTLLHGVASGSLTPDQAYDVLFPQG